jgi:hypothetical protein
MTPVAWCREPFFFSGSKRPSPQEMRNRARMECFFGDSSAQRS